MLLLFKPTTISSPEQAVPSARYYNIGAVSAKSMAIIVVVFIGVFFRVFHFFHNRSLFIDELFLDINLIKLSFWELVAGAFMYEQKAPIGYLWVVKLCVLLLGKQEEALRLFSLLCGIGALGYFVPVARFFMKSWGVVVAVAIMALSAPCIYHASEAKQYSTELFAAVLALLFYTRYSAARHVGSFVVWGLLGALLLAFSFSVIFVLVGMAFVVCINLALKKQWNRLLLALVAFSIWAVGFALQYYFFISKYPESAWLVYFFKKENDAFMPISGSVLLTLKWLAGKFYFLFLDPLGLLLNLDGRLQALGDTNWKFFYKMGWFPAGITLWGLLVMLKKQQLMFALLLLPVVMALAASAINAYPFFERFTLVFAPGFILIAAYGLEKILLFYGDKIRVVLPALLLLLLPSLVNSVRQVITPSLLMNTEFNREVMLFVNENYREGDVVYVFWNMRQAYEFYKESYNLKYTAIEGSKVKNTARNKEEYLRRLQPDFAQFRGKKRLWFIYNDINRDAIGDFVGQPRWYHRKEFVPSTFMESYFARLGRKTKHYQHPDEPHPTAPHAADLYVLEQGAAKANNP
ncbi:hypothetical protein GCM10011495_06360 [Hymenobacter frigidus]|uniref:Glycosyltransferase RgtA/B/C/D-like domain-containing protein n=1 Tax=Hymenobacter frigidus TaxID=1524095 RepID=A0ABQ1ZYD4_9BACT|nr:glycosyltransferase family 39 protein [Hymenobacter frigidus]GGH80719.1 hypothetical protein GCM10011495_06360 [Hymenobacter frigidus]